MLIVVILMESYQLGFLISLLFITKTTVDIYHLMDDRTFFHQLLYWHKIFHRFHWNKFTMVLELELSVLLQQSIEIPYLFQHPFPEILHIRESNLNLAHDLHLHFHINQHFYLLLYLYQNPYHQFQNELSIMIRFLAQLR